jgi:SET domain-containing protein
MALTDTSIVDASVAGNVSRYMNSSCVPNCETRITFVFGLPCIGVYALRALKAGEELTIEYNLESGARKIKCRCGNGDRCKGFL